MKKIFFTLFMLPAMVAVADTDNDTEDIMTFDTEEEFVEHLIEGAIDYYAPKSSFDIHYRSLLLENRLTFQLGFQDTDIFVTTPINLYSKEFNGALFTINYRF